MQRLQDLMTTLQEKSEHGYKPMSPQDMVQYRADDYNRTSGTLDALDGYNCEICNNRGYIATVTQHEIFGYFTETLIECKCKRIRRAIGRLRRSGLKNIVQDYTFDKYETPTQWQQAIKEAAVRFTQDSENDWFFVGGQSGAGKTHLCTAIAVHYIRQGKEARYMLWRDDINKIKAVVNDHAAYAELVQPLKEAEVLYIDDLFKSGKGDDGKYKPPTTADVNAAFEIINYRYNNPGLITIISSERTLLELNEIDEAIAGRIAEKSKEHGYCVSIRRDSARNWRMKGCGEI